MDPFDDLTVQCRSRIGRMLGDGWRLEALIGIGGMAAVYAASRHDGQMFAVKILHPEVGAMPEARARFLREATIANTVGHPGTVRVVEAAVDDDGLPYMAMELLTGHTVDALAKRVGGRLPAHEVVRFAEETLAVLEAAHARDIVHRDIKPENLFVTSKGSLKVLDFGIARLRESKEMKTLAAMTRTGMVMGTPAFMAPEQALGRWADVDARTDLWAVGATMFTLLTGIFVHEGETLNEMLVSAATRPARSLARILPDAGVDLVRVVDRALAYDRDRRFESAAAMRAELAQMATRSSSTPGQASPRASQSPDRASQTAPGTLQTAPPTMLDTAPPTFVQSQPMAPRVARSAPPARASGRPPERELEVTRASDLVDAEEATAAEQSAMKEIFIQIERAFVGKTQYGAAHAETTRRYERAFHALTTSLRSAELGLVWSVSPYSFYAVKEPLWEPDAPHDRVPYGLFSAGVRRMAFLPGVTLEEVQELLRILTLDPAEIPAEDDVATLLWDACFEHVLVYAIDSFAEGDQAARAAFERDRQAVIEMAHAGSGEDIERAWRQAGEPDAAAVLDKPQRLLDSLGRRTPLEADAVARAQTIHQAGPNADAPATDALWVDPSVIAVLVARLATDPGGVSERFVVAAADAYRFAHRRGIAEAVATPLRASVDGLATTAPGQAISFACALCDALGDPSPAEAEKLRASMAGELFSIETMKLLLASAAAGNEDELGAALPRVLVRLDGTHVPAVIAALPSITKPAARGALLAYVARFLTGNEVAVGAVFPTADVELGLALVRLLAATPGPSAREATSLASKSPHPVVRIEALGNVEGVSSERLRVELRGLLEDKDAGVRVAALKAMGDHKIKVAGPFLVLRIRGGTFDALPIDERRQALATVCTLTEARAEAVAIELLGDGAFFGGEAREQTRELAAEMLGRIGTGGEATSVLQEVAKQRFRASKRVREAAVHALAQIAARTSEGAAGGPS